MIGLLKVDDFYNQSEEIEIAKGKYQIPKTLKQTYNKMKRVIKYKK